MDTGFEIITMRTKNHYELRNISKFKINKLLSLQILNLFFLTILIYRFKGKSKSYSIIKKKKTISDKINFLKLLTNNDEYEYKGIRKCLLRDPDKQSCIYHLILPKEVIGKKRILIGEKHDGCYVLLDDLKNIKIAYSFGVGGCIQFDKALADKGIDIYMYDHTVIIIL